MREPNGCSTSAPRSSAAKQWFEQLAQKKKNVYFPVLEYAEARFLWTLNRHRMKHYEQQFRTDITQDINELQLQKNKIGL